MKFDYCLGNPPYQETQAYNNNKQLWPDFVKESTRIADIACLIHPGRWVIPKKNAKNLQLSLINDFHLKSFIYFTKADYCFSNINLDGGISITYFDNDYNDQQPTYYIDNRFSGVYYSDAIIFTTPFLEEVYYDIFNKLDKTRTMLTYFKGSIGTLDAHNFGVSRGGNSDKIKETPDKMKEPIKVWCNLDMRNSQGEFAWRYIEKNDLEAYPDYLFSSRKVMITNHGNAIHSGKGNVINNNPQICDKLSTGVNVMWFYPAHDTDRELELIKSLFMTKTARYLMSIKQRDRCCMGFECIPDYLELAKLLPENQLFTDEWFYKTFNFSQELINEIETRVSSKIEK